MSNPSHGGDTAGLINSVPCVNGIEEQARPIAEPDEFELFSPRPNLVREFPADPAGYESFRQALANVGSLEALAKGLGVPLRSVVEHEHALRIRAEHYGWGAAAGGSPATEPMVVQEPGLSPVTVVDASETNSAPEGLTPAPDFEGLRPKERGSVATCRVAVDSEDVELTEVLAWVEPDEADPAFVSWKHASGAAPTHVAIELARTPAELVAWMVRFDEGDEDADDDLGDEAGEITTKLAALRAKLAQVDHAPVTAPEAEREAEEAASHPALLFLKALGKDPANTWFRTFVPRGKPNRHRFGRDLHGLDIAALEADNRAGEAIYFITGDADQATGKNKEGKATGCVCDDDITHCRALFVEWDDRPIEWQRTAWQELKLPKPSLMAKTGGKSIQCYWLLTHPMAPAEWEVLQSRLIDFASGDKKCKNPSRLMRLPGFRYVDKETRELTDRVAELVHQIDVAYSAAAIEACLVQQPTAKGGAVAVSGIAQALEKVMQPPPRSKAQLLEALKVVPEFHHNEGRRDELLGLALRLRVEWGAEEAHEWLERHSPTVTDMASYFSGREPQQISEGSIWPFLRERYGVDLTRHDLKQSAIAATTKPKKKREARKIGHGRAMALFERCVEIQAKRERNSLRRRARLLAIAKALGLASCINRQEIAQRVLEAKDRQQGQSFKALTAADRMAMKAPVVRWLIANLVPAGDLTIIGGRPKVGKTRLAVAIASAVLKGTPFAGFGSTKEPQPVVLITDDQADGDTHQMLIQLQIWGHPLLIWSPHFRLNERDIDAMLETIKGNPGALVVIDSLRSVSRSLQHGENDPEIGSYLYDLKAAVVEAGGSLIVIHHCNKTTDQVGTEALSGHNAIAGAANTILTLHHCPDANSRPDKSNPQRRLFSESRSGDGCDLVIDRQDGGTYRQVCGFDQWQQQLEQARQQVAQADQEERVLGRATETQKALLEWLRDHPGESFTRRELVKALGLEWVDGGRGTDAARVKDALVRLGRTGLVSVAGGNTLRYSLPSRDTQNEVSPISPSSPPSDTKGSAGEVPGEINLSSLSCPSDEVSLPTPTCPEQQPVALPDASSRTHVSGGEVGETGGSPSNALRGLEGEAQEVGEAVTPPVDVPVLKNCVVTPEQWAEFNGDW